MNAAVKREIAQTIKSPKQLSENIVPNFVNAVIELSSSESDSSSSDSDSNSEQLHKWVNESGSNLNENGISYGTLKKRKMERSEISLPVGFVTPDRADRGLASSAVVLHPSMVGSECLTLSGQGCKQFWKAGDYEGLPSGNWDISSGGMDHVRVHPKFLHSNATSHKWALGAFAELLDNSLDEVCNGATFVNVDMLQNRKDGSRMLLIEDNGGGMDPDKMRHCMSLGYSAKNKMVDAIGQYGNGFKTSTMRLGADVIVFSRSYGTSGSATESIGLLSYTFLRGTGKEDIVVPMLDYERKGMERRQLNRVSSYDWNKNLETMIQWSPFSSEEELLHQFDAVSDHGTRIIIYNLWEDDQGLLELDFDADPHDIQLRGVNRDEKNIQMAEEFPNSRHFLTYRHSLRSYTSILYLRLPPHFRIILRGKDVVHHNIVNDMMLSQEITYRPQPGPDGLPRDINMTAVVTIGFVKDAKNHIDVQGFNVYHKNRLIKPFWRLWNAAGSDGRGVIGVLEANFVEPAHDKQGFERTNVLSRLESRLVQMQKSYWSTNCDKIGYAPRRSKKYKENIDGETYSEYKKNSSSKCMRTADSDKYGSFSEPKLQKKYDLNGHTFSNWNNQTRPSTDHRNEDSAGFSPASNDVVDTGMHESAVMHKKDSSPSGLPSKGVKDNRPCVPDTHVIDQLKLENHELKQRLERLEICGPMESKVLDCENCKLLNVKLQEANKKVEEMNKEQEGLIDIFSEERERRDKEEDNLRHRLKVASNTIQELVDKVKMLERQKTPLMKIERD